MKVAIISDIHGNDLALEAVLADIDALGIADIVNLGDHVSGPLNAARTADILMARNIPSISGNHDRYLLTLDPTGMGLSDRAAHAELQPRHLEWLATLPATLVYRDAFFLCHGTPASDEAYWLEALTAEGVVHLAARSAIEVLATGIKQPVILCGHTHTPRAIRLADGRLVVNPGSVGCPGYDADSPVAHKVEVGSPDARYAIVESVGNDWSVTFRTVPYQHETMARLAAQRNRLQWAQALATGFLGG
ncbi:MULTISPECIES: metallophosphoesterase family protein [Ensifer]|jgi:putative phosphoesterase|uniref:Metallophosphoesterase n=1 Tax=Ensifer canadensis TaxID=555315 RepID=A0AAW4FIX6_9HYPH|nr:MULTISPECIES: metallophosphoesterase family protein [Ensifer]AHK43982.1 putative DNA repair protein [Ensifer adhaerens OV14]MDP9629663.1 putative phosphoesterase [Ensifer adhaerens]KQW44152.1 metallophosphoesterase [Ensifer sp. Root1252]KQY61230.1 metallophosphoesterase [Ensifer sp. Root142]KRC57866.1 metallophosphoesterase [Ensifer sp. Root231]